MLLQTITAALLTLALGTSQPDPAQVPPPAEPGAAKAALRVLWTVPTKSHCFGSAAVADADGDGMLDVAFASYFGDASVRVLRGKDGSVLWSYQDEKDNCYDASCRFADVTGDGKLNLIVPCSSGSRVHCFDAATGISIWSCSLERPECIDTPPWIGDADGDGATDVVVGTFQHNLKIIRGKSGELIRSFDIGKAGAVQTCAVVMDVNGDNVPDLIGGLFGKANDKSLGVHAVSGKDGSELWHMKVKQPIYHGPAVGALTVGGPMVLTIGCYDGRVYRIDPKDGSVLAAIKPGERYIMAPITLVDLDGDGSLESIATSERITAINADNTIRWSKPVAPGGRAPYENVCRGVSVADLDGDNKPDLAYVTSAGLLRVLNGSGEVVYEYDCVGMCGEGKSLSNMAHGPVLADLNGDGRLDVFFVISGGGEGQKDGRMSARYGAAVCLTGFAGVPGPDGANGWYSMRHDEQNTGNVGTPLGGVLRANIAATAKRLQR